MLPPPFPLSHACTQALHITGAGSSRYAHFPTFFFFFPSHARTQALHDASAGGRRYVRFPDFFCFFPSHARTQALRIAGRRRARFPHFFHLFLLFFRFPHFFSFSPSHARTQALRIAGAGGRRRAHFPHFFSFSLSFFPFPPHTCEHRYYTSLAQVAGDVRVVLDDLDDAPQQSGHVRLLTAALKTAFFSAPRWVWVSCRVACWVGVT